MLLISSCSDSYFQCGFVIDDVTLYSDPTLSRNLNHLVRHRHRHRHHDLVFRLAIV